MANAKNALLMMGGLAVILLILVVVFSVALLIGSEFKEQICTQDGGTYTAGTCSVTSQAYNATVNLLSEITTVVGFIGLAMGGRLLLRQEWFLQQLGLY